MYKCHKKTDIFIYIKIWMLCSRRHHKVKKIKNNKENLEKDNFYFL